MLKQKVVAVGTDYTCIPFWEETECDYYVAPHKEAVREWTAYGIPREKVLPIGIPVRPNFAVQANREKARAAKKGNRSLSSAEIISAGNMP